VLSRAQQILLKRAQREAGLGDEEYRHALGLVAACRSSKDAALSDRHLDLLLGFFEAVHWRAVDAGTVRANGSPTAVFRQRGYWSRKNTRQESSRDRFLKNTIERQITEFESALAALGFGADYCQAIRARAVEGRRDPHSQFLYRSALARTLCSKQKARPA